MSKSKSATAVIDAPTAFNKIAESCEQFTHGEVRKPGTMSCGDYGRQGDIYPVALDEQRLAKLISEGKVTKVVITPEQLDGGEYALTPGTGLGASHKLVLKKDIEIYTLNNANPLQGPIIKAPSGCYGSHGEHAHFELPSGVHFITYQRRLADNVERAQD